MLSKLESVAERADLRLMSMAMAFPLANPAVTSVILGPRKLEQYRDMEAGFETQLAPSTLDEIDALLPPGNLIEEADRGYVSPWMTPEVRREGVSKLRA
jgi:aryl-alcohol dehydrogenase-like predicted oxidoreductase